MGFWELFSTPQGVAAQCVGFVAMGVAFFIYAFRDRRKILFTKLIADALWMIHYVLLGAHSGAVINTINVVREGVFYHKEKPWASHLFWPFLFVAANAVSTAFSWQGWISLLPLVGSSLNVLALWCASPKRIRLIALPALTMWEIYSILVGSVSSTIVNGISIVSILFAMGRDLLERRKNA
ncbi:MAG: YgjV family protein [Clostridia bacterium]|nr:YgjV family protein [Clostridia bacterium]